MPADKVRHFLARSGFEASANEILASKNKNYPELVERMLDSVIKDAETPEPDWVDELPPSPRERKKMSVEEKKELRYWIREKSKSLKAWWYQEMINTSSPLTERMTLFWHNHFTSSLRKVRWPPLLYRQNLLLRKHALGNFRDLLKDIAKDPAMLLYLDNARNFKNKNNENFARELLELFTLGEGHYSEQDIREAARAFTGWTVNRRTTKFRVARFRHDNGDKTFLGYHGNFNGDDIIEIILKQPQVSEFIVSKLWYEFISPELDEAEVERLATLFRKNNYEIKPLMREIFLSKYFMDIDNRGVLVKSPVDLLVGTVRMFKLKLKQEDMLKLAGAGKHMGQDIFDPPNVRGWKPGEAWIDANSLLIRQNIIKKITKKIKSSSSVKLRQPVDDEFRNISTMVMLALPPIRKSNGLTRGELIMDLMNDPVYQVK